MKKETAEKASMIIWTIWIVIFIGAVAIQFYKDFLQQCP